MSSVVEEIIIEGDQGSHIVSILEDGCLGTPLIYSTKVNAIKGKVVLTHSNDEVFSDKFGNNCDSDVQGIDNQRQTRFSSSEHAVSQQLEVEIFGENTNGRLASNQLINGSREASDEGVSISNSENNFDNFQCTASCNFLETR